MATPSGASSQGASDFLALSRRLKAAGETELRKELHKAMTSAAKPLIPKVRSAAASKFPQSGGLAKRVSKKPYRAQTRTGATTAGVRITASKMDPRLDGGRVYHPVFGRRLPIPPQEVPGAAGFFSETLANSAPDVMGELTSVLTDFAQRVTRGGI